MSSKQTDIELIEYVVRKWNDAWDTSEYRDAWKRIVAALADPVDAKVVAWSLKWPNSPGQCNPSTTFATREQAEQYAAGCSVPDVCDPSPATPVVVPLSTPPPRRWM